MVQSTDKFGGTITRLGPQVLGLLAPIEIVRKSVADVNAANTDVLGYPHKASIVSV